MVHQRVLVPRVTCRPARVHAQAAAQACGRWPFGLGPPPARLTRSIIQERSLGCISRPRSSKNETWAVSRLYLCLSVELCVSVALRMRARSAVRSVAEERTAEARVRRARAAPSMGCKELPTHTKQPSSVALCGRLRSGERPGRARGGGAKRGQRARNDELDFVCHHWKAQRPSGELRGHTSGAVGSRGHANLSAPLGSKRPLELNSRGVRA